MTGNLADIMSRLWKVLPGRWFSENSPNLQSLLLSIATPWVWLFDLLRYVVQQTRLGTATDDWLDLIALDFFGANLSRKPNEPESTYRSRIQLAMVRNAATRSAVGAGLKSLVGSQPIIFEPANCGDTGSYGSLSATSALVATGTAYGMTGGWGSLQHPLQFFVTVTRPPTLGLGALAGYDTPNGGYGEGAIAYADLSLLPGHVTDEDIQATLCSLMPLNAVAWLRIV